MERASGLCKLQRILENVSEKYEATTSVEYKFGQTCGGWKLVTIHGEHLGYKDMLSCKGAEDTVIASVSGDAHTHITPRQRK